MALQPKPAILTITPYKPGLSKAGSGKQVIKLSSNESPLKASPKAVAAYKNLEHTLFRYPDGGSTMLREAIGEVYGLDPDKIICGAGSDEIIAMLCHAYSGPGDEVIYTEYGFLMYPIYAKIAGATPIMAKETNLTTDVDAILSVVTQKTRIVFIANPNNPTGSYITKSELSRLRKGLRDDILLVVDGAYAEYVSENDYSCGQELVESSENTVMTRTFSKIYGLAGLRIGWAYCPSSITDVLNRTRGPFNVSSPAIYAASAAVRDKEFTKSAKDHNDEWLPWLTKKLYGIGLKTYPSVANFILVEFPAGANNADKADSYLMEKGIIGRKVASYGLPNCLRFTVGLEEENKALVEALKDFLASHS